VATPPALETAPMHELHAIPNMFQCPCDIHTDPEGLRRRWRPAFEPLPERLSLHEFHGDEVRPIGRARGVDLHEVGVIQARGDAEKLRTKILRVVTRKSLVAL